MRGHEISSLMNDQAQRVAEYLLPNGKLRGGEWIVGGIDGERGNSMKVRVDGTKRGAWCDFESGKEKGDLISLWMAVRNIGFRDAVREAKEFLGVVDNKYFSEKQKTYSKPKLVLPDAGENVTAHIYLTHERGLDVETINKFKVTANEKEIIFPYYFDGELVNQKYLGIDRDGGKKQFRSEKDCMPCLFGWQAIDEAARSVIICEGEIDAMTLYQYGYNALSVPFGAGIGAKLAWLDNEHENLSVFDEIFICFDNDDAGQKSVDELVVRLGSYRCRVVTLPFKDANDCLKNNVSKDNMAESFLNSKTFQPKEIKRPTDFEDSIIQEMFFDEPNKVGVELPFKNANGEILFRTQELILWSGINGHGKSQMLGQVALHSMREGKRVMIASLEMPSRRMLIRMVTQASGISGNSKPSIEYAREIVRWLDDKLFIYDLIGTANQDRLLEAFIYARKRYGVEVFIIDSLMKCGVSEESFDSQKNFIDKVCNFKNDYNCHVHMIVHPRKSEDEEKTPKKMDIKGTGTITDSADTIISLWRNKKKEEKIKIAKNKHYQADQETLDEPDCILRCDKQRNGGEEALVFLWYDKKCFQYLDSPNAKPISYVQYLNKPEEI